MLKTLHYHHIALIFSTQTLLHYFFFTTTHASSSSSSHQIFIYAGCSQEKYQSNSQFQTNLNTFLTSILTSSSQYSFHSFAIGKGPINNNNNNNTNNNTIYGLYQCRPDLVPIDCKTCIETSLQQIGLVCPYSFGASLQLEGCSLRYEHVDFLGKVDMSVRYKRCRRPVSRHDHEFFWRRDRVVADLAGQPGGGGFRVSRSGFVEGYSECVGDLSTEDCSSCVVEAVRRLKGLCGSAAKGDVFLGKCYARYWASGYDEETPDSLKEDQVRKATAIIVGLLASLVILIAILSICQRAMGKK